MGGRDRDLPAGADGAPVPLVPPGVLGALRVRARLTQEELAERSGLSVRTIRNLERGAVPRPRWRTLELIGRALGGSESAFARAVGQPPERQTGTGPPAQLPPATADLTGRRALMARAQTLLTALGDPPVAGAASLVNLSGRPGVGKTCLATALGHAVRDRFPAGQLFVDLRGAGPARRPPRLVLGDLLVALGVEVDTVPEGLDARTALFRQLTTGRRILVVLDDAADEPQVQHLVPSAPGAVLITSRRPLAGLPGVRVLDVDLLPPAESLTLLTVIVGAERAAVEPAELARVAASCGGLPLALRIAGARLVAHPTLPVRALATALEDEHHRLDELRFGELAVRAPLALVVDALPVEDCRALALLGRLDLPTVSVPLAEAVLDRDRTRTSRALEALVDARLLDVAAVDGLEEVRYRFHDLVRLLARELPVDPGGWPAALLRLAGCLLTLSAAADAALPATSDVLVHGSTPRWPAAEETVCRIRADPLPWFAEEEATVTAVVDQCVAHGLAEPAWEVASYIGTYALLHSRWELWRATHEAALAACQQEGNARGAASMRFGLGKLHHDEHALGAPGPDELAEAAQAFSDLGEVAAESRADGELASWYAWAGEPGRGRALAERSLALARESGSAKVLVDALFVLGRLRVREREWAGARTAFEEALERCRPLHKARSEAQLLWQLGLVRQAEQQPALALRLLQEAVGALRQQGDRRGEARVLIDVGAVAALTGDHLTAEAALSTALQISRAMGTANFEALALVTLAGVREGAGERETARQLLTAAARLWRQLGDDHRLHSALAEVARLDLALAGTPAP